MTDQELNTLSTFETGYTDSTPTGDGLLRINWYNGDPKLKTPGAFFVSQKRLDAAGIDAPDAPWQPVSRTFNDGSTDDGYGLAKARLQILGIRRQDCALDADGRITQWLNGLTRKEDRPFGWSIFVEVLLHTPGFPMPVVWSSKRVKTSMAIVANIARDFKQHILEPARKHYNNPKIPGYAFWALIKGAVDAKGAPIYEKTQGAPVTPPTLIVPDKEGVELFKALFVGNDLLQWGEEQRGIYDDWLRTLPGDARTVEAAHDEPKNPVLPIEDDDSLF